MIKMGYWDRNRISVIRIKELQDTYNLIWYSPIFKASFGKNGLEAGLSKLQIHNETAAIK